MPRFCFFLLLFLVAQPDFGQVRERPNPSRRVPADEIQLPASMRFRVDQNLVTAEIRHTPLQRVLEEFSAWTGLVFEVDAQENPLVSVRLEGASFESAIQRITPGYNSVTYYDYDAEGGARISYVRIFTRSDRNDPPSLRYIGSGRITKTEADAVDTPEQALALLEKSDSVEARQKAVEVLVDAKHPEAQGALTKALADPAPQVRVAAIEGLAGLGARSALPGIVKALKDSDPSVRQSAIVAVSFLGDFENVRDLRPLARDRDSSVAAAAEVALRKLSVRRP